MPDPREHLPGVAMRETLEALSSLGEPAEQKELAGWGDSGVWWACCFSRIKKAKPSL